MSIRARAFERDLKEMIFLSDQRKAANRAARERVLSDERIMRTLEDEARRRGQSLSWPEYFSNLGIWS